MSSLGWQAGSRGLEGIGRSTGRDLKMNRREQGLEVNKKSEDSRLENRKELKGRYIYIG